MKQVALCLIAVSVLLLRNNPSWSLEQNYAESLADKTVISNSTATRGDYSDKITIKWFCGRSNTLTSIYRSVAQNGHYEKIGETKMQFYEDFSAKPGLLYYYKLTVNGKTDISANTSGYVKPPSPAGISMDELAGMKTSERPAPPNSKIELEREDIHLALLRRYYDNYFMINIIYLVSRLYVNSGELIIYMDFNSWQYDSDTNILFLSRAGELSIKLYSEKFSRLVRSMEWSNTKKDLLPKLIKNATAFCIRTGESEFRGSDGITRYVPHFEAAGISLEYFRNFKNWKGNTVVCGSDDPEISKKIREAGEKAQ